MSIFGHTSLLFCIWRFANIVYQGGFSFSTYNDRYSSLKLNRTPRQSGGFLFTKRMKVDPIKNCPHINISNLIPITEFSKLPFHRLKCENCDEKNELWICITCGKSFCGRYKNNHFYDHYITKNNQNHNICISFLDLSIWCYKCETKGFSDKGSYISNEICAKYVDILCQFKFSANFQPKIYDIFYSFDFNKQQITNIKYYNFIELLKNEQFSRNN